MPPKKKEQPPEKEAKEVYEKPEKASDEEIEAATKSKSSGPKMTISNEIKRMVGVSLIVSILVVILMGVLGVSNWVTKQEFANNLLMVSDNLSARINNVAKQQSGVSSAIQAIPEQINQTMAQTVGQINTNVTNLSDRVNQLQGNVDALKNSKDPMIANNTDAIANVQSQIRKDQIALETRLVTIENRITALENRQGTGVYSSGAFDIQLASYDYTAIFSGAPDAFTYVEIDITNTSDTPLDLDRITFELTVDTGGTIPSGLNLEYTRFSFGNHYAATHYYSNANPWQYDVALNNLNYTMNAGQTRTITMPFMLHSTTTQNTTIYLYMDIHNVDYELE